MNVGEKINIGEPVYKIGSLFGWRGEGTHSPFPLRDTFVITDVSPVGTQQCDTDPVIWEWQYQVYYLRTPVNKGFLGETEIKTLIRATELQLLSEGDI